MQEVSFLRSGYGLYCVTFGLGVGFVKSLGAKRDKTSLGLRSVLYNIWIGSWAFQKCRRKT